MAWKLFQIKNQHKEIKSVNSQAAKAYIIHVDHIDQSNAAYLARGGGNTIAPFWEQKPT